MGKSDETDENETKIGGDDLDHEMDRFFEIIGKLAGISAEETPKPDKSAIPRLKATELDEEMIEKFLLSPNPLERVKGRLMATGVAETMRQFVDTERERGTQVGAILIALNEITAMLLGSVIIQNATNQPASVKLGKALVAEFARTLQELIELGWKEFRQRQRP